MNTPKQPAASAGKPNAKQAAKQAAKQGAEAAKAGAAGQPGQPQVVPGGGAADTTVAPLRPGQNAAPNAPAVAKVPAEAPPHVGPPRKPAGAVARPVSGAQPKPRHYAILISLVVCVLIPGLVAAWYLYTRASDQYASTVAFSVRTEEKSSALEVLGGITELSGSSSSDTDILFEYLQSQKLVADIDAEVDLRSAWAKPENDPVFAFQEGGTIEDLVSYWTRMVQIYYDDGAGLIEVRVLAFDPQDATRIAETLFRQSSEMINGLSAIAREDSIRYAREELEVAQERLRAAREEVTRFRNVNQLVDPSVDVQTQAGLLGRLEAQLADALIELDLLANSTRADDPRVTQAQRRIEVIEDRIAAERRKLGIAGDGEGTDAYANLFGEYERLVVDREFAEQSYTSAQAAYDGALADARRQSRYLAAYVRPTLAESSRFPERLTLLGLTGLFLLLVWATGVLIYYALKDRR